MRLHRITTILGLVSVAACGDASEPATPSPGRPSTAALRLRVEADSLPAGFAAMAIPLDSLGAIIPATQVTFTSNAPEIATVSAGGQIVGVTPGEVTITARRGPDSARTTLRVTPTLIGAVEILLPTGPVHVGDSTVITAVARDVAGRVVPFPHVEWSSSNSGTVELRPSGLLIPRRTGTASLSARVGGAVSVVAFTVPPRPVGSITLTASQDSLTYLMPALLVADVRAPNGRQVIDRAPRFIAGPGMFVSQRGEVVFPDSGAARTGTVAVELDGVRAEYVFTLVPPDGETLGLESFGTTLRRDTCGWFRAEVLDRFALPIQSASVRVADPSIVRVANGEFLPFALCGVAPGTTTVTFGWGDRSWAYDITVVDGPRPSDVRLLSPVQRLEVGSTHVTRIELLTVLPGQSRLLRWPVSTATDIANGVRAYAVGDSLVVTGITPVSTAQQLVRTEALTFPVGARVVPPSDNACTRVAGADLFASSGEYLGRLSDTSFVSAFLSESSRRSGHSVMNIYGRNGSPTSPQSAWNLRATEPPYIRRGSETLGRLTLNSAIPGAINPGAVVHCR